MSACIVLGVVSARQAPALRFIPKRKSWTESGQVAFPKGLFYIRFGTIWQPDFGSPREPPLQEVPNDQIPMPGHNTSDWRPTIVNSHRRLHV